LKTKEQVSAFFSGDLFIYVLGFFDYEDKGGRRYKTAFCRRYDLERSVFVKVSNSDYEFTD
jgi:hypothetical protein